MEYFATIWFKGKQALSDKQDEKQRCASGWAAFVFAKNEAEKRSIVIILLCNLQFVENHAEIHQPPFVFYPIVVIL